MKLLGIVLAVLLLACAGMGEARMPKVGDSVVVKMRPVTVVTQESFLVYEAYVGNITDLSESALCLNSTSSVIENQYGRDLESSDTPHGMNICLMCCNIDAILLNSSSAKSPP